MTEVIGVVEQGQIKLPPTVRLPDGWTVKVAWDESQPLPPLEDEEWTEEEMRLEIEQALKRRTLP